MRTTHAIRHGRRRLAFEPLESRELFANVAPSFNAGPNVVAAGSAPQTIAHWATNISAGPASESGQMLAFLAADAPTWGGYAGDPRHTATSPVASQSLDVIRWQTPVDLAPQYSGNDLLIHYGSPLVTEAGTVIVPVKTGATDGFRIEARSSLDGAVKWSQTTDYTLPPHNWTPSYAPTLTPLNRLYFAGAGGTVYYRDTPDSAQAAASGQRAFYGLANYQANPAAYNGNVFISTPIVSDQAGNVYFGFQVNGSTPLGLQSGLARIAADGTATYVAATAAAGGDASLTRVVYNCAPALSSDGTKLYVALSNSTGFGSGALVELDSATLGFVAKVALHDPKSGNNAYLPDDGTASPTVGPDGDVYFGVLENPFPANHDRGWLLHFSGDLSQSKTPGAFGWDDTASIMPASMVASYQGTSSYLLMTKYNNYAGVGGDGVNKIAVLDPAATQTDPITGATVMREVLTIAGPTPDPEYVATHPNAVREWCINTAAVDPRTHSVLVNSEDGKLYRWDLTTNTLSQTITLTSGIGEAYTPTVVGSDGTVYAISNATLFAVGVSNPGTHTRFFASPPAINPANGTLTFTLAPGALGTVTVSIALMDDGGTTGGGVDTSAWQTFTITGNPPPPTVESVALNGSTAGLAGNQRSIIADVTVTFSGLVTFDAAAFNLVQNATGGAPLNTVSVNSTITTVGGKTVATLTFSGSGVESNATHSLADGNYVLTIYGANVHDATYGTNLDGDADGLPGGNRTFGSVASDKFFRLFGDSDGDRDVDNLDYARFRNAFNTLVGQAGYAIWFNFDGDSDVDTLDYARFRARYATRMDF